MMVSFPAGIVQVVANNPHPAQLSFKIRNASVFESIVPNLKLVTPSELLSTPDGKVFEFKMDALKELLKVQSEMNPNAAYFNIDLLKYQVSALYNILLNRLDLSTLINRQGLIKGQGLKFSKF